jgi:alkylresorcinol/alkylpyrone synthase
MSLTIACELTSLTYYPEPAGKPEPEGSFELLRSNSIFADGCSCALLGYDDDPRHPTIIDYVSLVNPAFINELGYTWRNGRLRVHLSKQVPVLASSLLDKSVRKLLGKNSLRISDIRYWIVHPPGSIVIDKIRDSLGIPEEKLQYSRKALRLYGNCSSSTIGIVGKLLMNEREPGSGFAVMANVGPGMVSNAALLYFGG